MKDSKIEWTRRTWNPVRGCSRVSPGCKNCFAEVIAARFSDPGQPFHLYADRNKSGSKWTGKMGLIEEKLREPLSWREPGMCFVNSMSDLFHDGISFEQIDQVFGVMAITGRNTYQVLTKRSGRAREYFDGGYARWEKVFDAAKRYRPNQAFPGWPLPNVWLGVSVESQEYADSRIPDLLATPAAVRFVSYEPALGPVDFSPHAIPAQWSGKLHWVIVGGESGHGARPFDIAWARQTVEQCKAAGVACFVKQLGKVPYMDESEWRTGDPVYLLLSAANARRVPENCVPLKLTSKKGGDMDEWPADLRVREFPVVTQ